MAKKYILEDGYLKAASAIDFHRELVSGDKTENNPLVSGGWWEHDQEKQEVTFYSRSTDYGGAKKEDIIDALKNERLNQRRWIGCKFFFSESRKLEEALVNREQLVW